MRRLTGIFWNKSFARMPWRDSVAMRLTGFELVLFGHLAGSVFAVKVSVVAARQIMPVACQGKRLADRTRLRGDSAVILRLVHVGWAPISSGWEVAAISPHDIEPFLDYHYDYLGTREPTALYWGRLCGNLIVEVVCAVTPSRVSLTTRSNDVQHIMVQRQARSFLSRPT